MLLIFLLFQSSSMIGQTSDEDWDLLLVREDNVIPSLTDEYEKSLADLRDILTEKDEKKYFYFTHLQDNYQFTHITPIKGLEELDKGIHNFVAKRLKDVELNLVLDYMNSNIDSYKYYVVQYQAELSYVPDGDDWGNKSYRKWSYIQFIPGTEKDVEEIFSSWKHLYEEKGIETGFRIFSGFLGIEQPTYILTTWSSDPLNYHIELDKVSTALGEEGALLWSKMMDYALDITVVEGWYLPQYSYAPGKEMAK